VKKLKTTPRPDTGTGLTSLHRASILARAGFSAKENDIFYFNKVYANKLIEIARGNNVQIEEIFLKKNVRSKNEELKFLEENLYSLNKKYNSKVNNIKLFLELNINNLIDVFRISKTKDIVAFRKVIYNMDISKDEVEIVKLLITELEDLVKTEQRKTQKLNFEYLIDNLNEKLKFVSS